ncbi:MAG: beta-hydroxyacyl-ACP dehydratase [Phycisphaeraceae bacterium]|nr:beta-hydroxyacyl-ACP dehydratase [Phycisphaeraceae bacterium]
MRWMWIDRITELTPGERLTAVKHVSLAEEHLHDHFAADAARGLPPAPTMPACFIIEGMAQSAGILVGHTGAFKEKVVLAKVSRVELTEDAAPGDTLRYTATLDRMDDVGAQTSGVVELCPPDDPANPREIGRIDLMFSHLDNNMGGQKFPEHNFVFSDSFRTLLRSSGIEAGF